MTIQTIVPTLHDLGGFTVGRLLPAMVQRSVGPFVFLDRMGPGEFAAGQGVDVRPHPHIGLATLTYLFAGAITHRDSVGSVQDILPGDVNWMVSGRGIAHSERTPVKLRRNAHTLDGMQCWLALPLSHEETDPGFFHFPAADLPLVELNGARICIVAGHGFGRCAPVPVHSGTLFADIRLQADGTLKVPTEHEQRAIYPISGDVALNGETLATAQLHLLGPALEVTLQATTAAHFIILGGEPLDAPRHLWWNFVSSSAERIEQAKDDWRAGRFSRVPGETEWIPLPAS